uniref:Uncharacterized protein n=1 Tax=Kalanchoe fedtschenkoi TaxID=63787 RepID=A0A7N0TVC6_KALFE
MSTPDETQTMLQMRYRVKQLMEEVLARFQKKEALLKKSNLWKDLQKLHDKISEVQSYIGDCVRQNQVKLMEKIEEKVYLAGDFLDEVAFQVLEWEHDSDTRRKVLTSTSQTPETKGMSETLDKIKTSLENLIVEASKTYNLQPGVIPGSDLTFKKELELHKSLRSSLENVEMIGRSEELEKLINVLLEPGKDEEAPLQIIPIVGQEGIGKTTLARAAYDHKQIQDHFDLRIWVCVSTSIEAKWICGKILEALAPNRRVELDSADEILALLLEELGGKSFFLALDDVSGTEADLPRLKLLKDCLLRLNTTRRNKIVITTCSSKIAEEMEMHNQFHLQKLSDDDCMAILNKEAFEGVQLKDIEYSINLARGIPFAAKVLGTTVNNSKEWQTLAESVINDKDTIDIPEEDKPIFMALHLSYLHLPLGARQCFSYMSMFPPNASIETDNIIQLWIAEGFFQSDSLIEMEDRGKECLHILLYTCLIESAERDCYGDISSVRLGRTASKLASRMQDPTDHRHRVSVHAQQQLVQAPENAELHTFFSVGNDVSYGKYKFGHLKVLNLSKSRFRTWPDAMEKLKLLRHLDVSGTTVTELPELISKLFYLQTIRATNCSYLGKLPTNISALKSLRHFCIDADNEAIRKGKFPKGVCNLTSLQTLPLLIVSEKPSEREELLGPLKKLRGKLTVCNLERLTSKDAEGWRLMEKDGISELRFEWSTNTQQTSDHMEVLDKLQPNNKLKRLTLKNFGGGEISMWKKAEAVGPDSVSLTNLVKLKLSNCNKCEKLPVLGTLPFLAELHIEGMENLNGIGSEFYTDKTTGTTGAEESRAKLFAVLRKLSLMYLANLKYWSKAEVADNEVFPLLEELRIEGCDALSIAPSHFQSLRKLHYESVSSGVPLANICTNLTTLTSVMISSVSDLQDLPEGILKTNPSLSSLQICNCPELKQIPNPGTWSCSNSLRSLTIFECEKLESLPENLQSVSSLVELILGQCHGLKSIPSLDGLSSLRRLKIEWCRGLEKLPSGLESCSSLEHLTIKGCPSLTSVQDEGLSKLTSLCSLNILGCDKLTALPFRELLHYLTKLRRLEIEGFTEETLGLTIEYPGLTGWARFKALPGPFQSKKIKGAWTIDPELLPAFATKAVGFLEAIQLFEKGVKAVKP